MCGSASPMRRGTGRGRSRSGRSPEPHAGFEGHAVDSTKLKPMRQLPFSARTAWDLTDNSLARELARARASGRALTDLSESNPTRAGIVDTAHLVALLGHPRG